jgi:hypothetical protein
LNENVSPINVTCAESKKVVTPPKKADVTKHERIIASSNPSNKTRVVSKLFDTKRRVAWVPKASQNIKPKDDVETSSNRITQHSNNASKATGRSKKMIWVSKTSQDIKPKDGIPTSSTRITQHASRALVKSKKMIWIPKGGIPNKAELIAWASTARPTLKSDPHMASKMLLAKHTNKMSDPWSYDRTWSS